MRAGVTSQALALVLGWTGVALGSPVRLHGGAPTDIDSSTPATLAREALRSLRELAEIPGISVAVGIGDSIVWSEGLGHADAQGQVPTTPATRFRIASVTKLLTAAIVGRLHERGQIDLDAPIQRYIPDWPAADSAITIRRLAGHLGGIRDYSESDFERGIDTVRYASVREALTIFRSDSLVADPGAEFRYSTFGYVLLSAALESAARMDFCSLIEQEILDPLRLRQTVPKLPAREIPGLTALFSPGEGGRPVWSPDISPTYKWAAGGYVSTAEDLVRFGLAHLQRGFLQDSTLSTLFTSQITKGGKRTGIGIGWMIARDPAGRRVLFHDGTQTGARSVLMVYPEARLVVAILSNLTNSPSLVEGTAMGVAEPFLLAASTERSDGTITRLAGAYRYRIRVGEEIATGRIELAAAGSHLEGWITAAPGAKVDRLRIPYLLPDAQGARGAIAAPEGLLLLTVREDEADPVAAITFHGGLRSSRLDVDLERTP